MYNIPKGTLIHLEVLAIPIEWATSIEWMN